MTRSLLSFLILISLVRTCFSQQEKTYTQYLNYPTSINPAYAGSRETLQIFGLVRRQWVGIEGAPQSSSFSMNTPLNHYNLGTGLSINRDELGPEQTTEFGLDLSYRVQISKKIFLNLGLKADGAFYQVNYSGAKIVDQGDPLTQQNTKSEFLPNFGIGSYLYGEQFFIGLSVPRVLNTDKHIGAKIIRKQAHYYLTAGYLFKLNPLLKIKPSFMIKAIPGARISYDLTAMMIFYDRFWIGSSFRNEDAVAAIFQYNITNQLRIGYAYDMGISNLSGRGKGSHEISLSYDLTFNSKRLKSPRYF